MKGITERRLSEEELRRDVKSYKDIGYREISLEAYIVHMENKYEELKKKDHRELSKRELSWIRNYELDEGILKLYLKQDKEFRVLVRNEDDATKLFWYPKEDKD